MFFSSSIGFREFANGIWQLHPVLIAAIHRIFSSLVTDTSLHDRLNNDRADVPRVIGTYISAGAISALPQIYKWVQSFKASLAVATGLLDLASRSFAKMSPVAFSGILTTDEMAPQGIVVIDPITQSLGVTWRWDYLCAFGASKFWLVLLFHDLKKAAKTDVSWLKVFLVLGISILVLGPGAAMVILCAWRERILEKQVVRKV